MAEDREYLYCTRSENAQLKAATIEAGGQAKFDREVNAYYINADGKSPEQVAEIKSRLGEYTSPEAQDRWRTDMMAKQAEQAQDSALVKQALKEHAPKAAEQDPSLSYVKAYPPHSQRKEFEALLEQTGSAKKFERGVGDEISHWVVRTKTPEAFAGFTGDDAKARYQAEHAEKQAGRNPAHAGVEGQAPDSPAVEKARAAANRVGGAFMGQYLDRGFRLSDPARDQDNHLKQLAEMRLATTPQILAVVGTTRKLIDELRDKEATMRAEAAGIAVDQVKAMNFADQKLVGQKDGKPVGLVGAEFQLNQSLSRGLKAIQVELEARGVGRGKPDRQQDQNKVQSQARDGVERPQSKGQTQQHVVSTEQSASNDASVMAAFAARRRGQGR